MRYDRPVLGQALSDTRGMRQGSLSGREFRGIRRNQTRGPWRGIVFVAGLVTVVAVVGIATLTPQIRDLAVGSSRSTPRLMSLPSVADIVAGRLGDTIHRSAGTRPIPVRFAVDADQGLNAIAQSLVDQGLLADPLTFTYLAVTQHLDAAIQVGSFRLDPTMTPQRILDRLVAAPDPVVATILLDIGIDTRIEQVAAYLSTVKGLRLDPEAYLTLMRTPPAWVRTEFPWLDVLPAGRSLEGFVGAGPVTVDADITHEDLVRLLLTRWEAAVGPSVIAQVRASGGDFYDTLTLASIIAKETSDDTEAARIAGVYLNRLDPTLWPSGLLDADPTVSYAVDTDRLRSRAFTDWDEYRFFGPVSNQSRRNVSSAMASYQTYRHPGLPDGPIVSPTLDDIRAAALPDQRGTYLYFFSCKGGPTQFATTHAQQRANIERCR